MILVDDGLLNTSSGLATSFSSANVYIDCEKLTVIAEDIAEIHTKQFNLTRCHTFCSRTFQAIIYCVDRL